MPDIQLTEPLSGPLTWPDSGYPFGGYTVDFIASPTNLLPLGFSLTRASTGTYFDSAGLLQTAAINAARGTYRWNGSSWVFDGTLREAAATNTCLQSEDLTTTWTSGAGVTTTANQYTAPTGAATMDRITASAGNTQHYLLQAPVNITAGTTVFSCFARYDNHQWLVLGFNEGTNVPLAVFDLLNGVVGTTGAALGTPTISNRITALGGGVYRCELISTCVSNAASTLYVSLNNSNSASLQTWNAAGTERVGAWGFQLETGSGATSYTPTTTVAASRSADVITAPVSGLLLNAQGFAAARIRPISTTSPGVSAAIVSDSTNLAIPLYFSVNTSPSQLAIFDNVSGRLFGTSVEIPSVGAVTSVATTWGGSTSNGAKNGVLGTAQSFTGNLGLGTTLQIGDGFGGLLPYSFVLQSLRLGLNFADPVTLANPF